MWIAGRIGVGCLVLGLIAPAALQAGEVVHDWPQWRGPERDGVWRETGILDRFPAAELEPRWSVPVGGGYSGPTVAEGRVYVTDRLTEPREVERVLCFDAGTGELLWEHAYPCTYRDIGYTTGPRASVLVHEGRAYSLGAMGDLRCLDAEDGSLLWKRDLWEEYRIQLRQPDWGVAASPLIEQDLLILHIGGEEASVVALDRETGAERWTALGDPASYAAPIVVDQAGRRVVVCYTADRLVGLDAPTGQLLWEYPMPRSRWPIAIPTPVLHNGSLLFATSIHEGSVVLRLDDEEPAVEEVWRLEGVDGRSPDGIQSLIGTPVIQDGQIFGPHVRGELRAIDLWTGRGVWETTQVVPTGTWVVFHLISHGPTGHVWIFNERGELVIARLSEEGYEEIDRAKLIAPTIGQLDRRGGVAWAHPAFARGHVFARSDEELVCVDLRAR